MPTTIGPLTYWAIESVDPECGQWLEVVDMRYEEDAKADAIADMQIMRNVQANALYPKPLRLVSVTETRTIHDV